MRTTMRWSRAGLAAMMPLAMAVTGIGGWASAPAQAATPTYTITTGSTGSYAFPDDSPAYPYIDKDGTFYFQSSHSLYNATQTRKWDFYTGSDMDHGAAAAISSQGTNADTSTFCNNSPTGLESTYAPAGSSFAERNYCDLIGMWVDPDTGNWTGLVHNEFTPQPFGDGLHYDSIDYATSTDQGKTWTIQDHVITSPFSTVRGDTTQFPNQTYYFGDGDPKLFVDNASGYFYLYYESQILDKSAGGRADFGHVARAPISQKMAPSSWSKWYGGTWTEPGRGGKEADLVPSGGTGSGYLDDAYNPNATGTVSQQLAAGTLPSVPPLAWMDVAYDAYLGKYIAMPRAENPTNTTPLHVYTTSDLATQQWVDMGTTDNPSAGGWYRSLLDSVSKTSNYLVGKTFRNYCMYNCTSTSGTEWVSTAIDTAPGNLTTAPVASGTAYQIAAGNGQYLAQSGTALTATTAGSGSSSSQQWVFTGTGDGFFVVTNAGSGQALGVDSTANGGRAWSAPVSLGSGASNPSVGQQWSIQTMVSTPASSGASTPTGSFRLVNRYSGLALSLTGATPATAPQRGWDNSGTGGDTSPSNAQTLAFPNTGVAVNAVSITAPGNQSSTAGTPVSLQTQAADSAAGQTLTYSATGLPTGLSINASTGLISGTPINAGSYTATVTATDTTGAFGATSITWAVSPANAGLVNSGFETGSFSGWTTSGASETVVNSGAHTGTYAAQLGAATATNGDSNAAQTFTVPSGYGTLSFWYNVTCPDTVTNDWATATLTDTTTNATTTPLAKTCAANSGWTQVLTPVTAGHTYTLTLTSHDNNSTNPTHTLFDDVALTTTGGLGSGGTFRLTNSNSGLLLDDPNSSTALTTAYVQNPANGGADQSFTVTAEGAGTYQLKNNASGQCLGITSGSKTAGATVDQYSCDTSANHLWTQVAAGSGYELVNANSNLCLDISGASTTSGAAAVQNTCAGASSQTWQASGFGSGGTFKLTNSNSGLLLDDPNSSTALMTAYVQNPANGGADQSFTVTAEGAGTYQLKNNASGQCLGITSASRTAGATVDQYACDTSANHLWTQVAAGSGYELIDTNSNLCLDISGASTTSGAAAVQNTCTGAPSQIWKIS